MKMKETAAVFTEHLDTVWETGLRSVDLDMKCDLSAQQNNNWAEHPSAL